MGRDRRSRPATVVKLSEILRSSPADVGSALLYQMTIMENEMLYPGKVESWVILLQNEPNSNNGIDPPIVV